MTKQTAWSYSSLNDFQNCPRAYQLKRVTKTCKTVETEAMRHGTIAHKQLEDRAVKKTELPEHLKWFEPSMVMFETGGGELVAETQIALDKGLKSTGWFDKTVWVRGIMDVTVRHDTRSFVGDYKTGKRKPNSDQLMLFAGLEFALRPEVEDVKTAFIWLKDKALDSETYTREDIPRIWGHFLPKVEKIQEAFEKDVWPAKPGPLCGWCPAKYAQCKFAKN